MSVDGYLDDASPDRLLLSNAADFDRVALVRAGVDAILVGANTIRRDNPRLVAPGDPAKVTITRSGDLDPAARFFTEGTAAKLVYSAGETAALAKVATIVPFSDLPAMLADLTTRGVRRLLVEGGTSILTQFLTAGLSDELHLAIAPIFVGDPAAPRFVHNGQFPSPMTLAATRQLGDLVVLRYLFGAPAEDWHRLREAIELSRRCPPSDTAFSVGAIIVDATGKELARGYSRELDPVNHAEEAALTKLDPDDPRLRSATLYSSMEPCGKRASRPLTCAQLILNAGIPRVVFAYREPPTFVDGVGAEILAAAGVEVVEVPELAGEAKQAEQAGGGKAGVGEGAG
jgi:riboflavin biosynthesis pyrimidine reductase/pyrimidine deaminase RibD-like protein